MMDLSTFWLLLCTSTLMILEFGNAERTETCMIETFSASCDNSEVILMTSAEYGRRAKGRCITKQEDFMGCVTDVLPLLDKLCSGRRKCEFSVPNHDLEERNEACLDYLKMYMETEYTCIQVETQCTSGKNVLQRNEAVLSSHVAKQTSCGSTRSPWKISVSPGKTINMTLFDFVGEGQSQGQGYVTCKYIYGYILEKSLGINHTICGGRGREVALYSSKTNNVEVHLRTQTGSEEAQFLIKYQAHGCSELKRPANAWYKREGNEAVIGCETNDQEWRLMCSGNTWHGTVGNCTEQNKVLTTSSKNKQYDTGTLEFSSIIIMTGIACGVAVLVVIAVMLGVIHLKKYRLKQQTKRMQTTYATISRHGHANYHPVTDQSQLTMTDTPSERLVDVPGTWIQPDTFGRQGTMTSYPDPCMCQTLQGDKNNPGIYETPKFLNK